MLVKTHKGFMPIQSMPTADQERPASQVSNDAKMDVAREVDNNEFAEKWNWQNIRGRFLVRLEYLRSEESKKELREFI